VRKVETFLAARGTGVFIPLIPVERRRGRSSVSAFFPRHLFVITDCDRVGLWTLDYAPGATGLVTFGGVPASVDDSVIAVLQARLANLDPVASSSQAMG
jgi:hypothetical protein